MHFSQFQQPLPKQQHACQAYEMTAWFKATGHLPFKNRQADVPLHPTCTIASIFDGMMLDA